tara:strand:- start:234 stop:647 length:414 start_codon:yes stop_codon:yes gene_type:complete
MYKILFIFFFQFLILNSFADIIIFKNCKNDNYTYEKNEYILDLNKGMMTRKFIYDEKSYKKLRLNDINIKKENVTNKGIAEENDLIVSEISGYPAFYTQMIFNKKESSIKIKTVLNDTEGESLIAKCDNIINYKKES